MRNYKAYGKNLLSDGNEILLVIGQARNKEHLRSIILTHSQVQDFSKIEFGKRQYTISDIYAGR